MAGVCKNAYGNKACKMKVHAELSNAMRACWLVMGFKIMITAEQVELEKVGQRCLPAPPVRTRSKRAHKNKMTSSETVVKKYSKDGNVCSHDDPNQWNEERSICYQEEKWRKRYYVENKIGFGLDYNCITCNKDVRERFIWLKTL